MEAATVYNRMVLPLATDDPTADYEALTQRVSLWDVGCQRQVQVQGPDALKLCQYLSARDLSQLRIGTAKYAPLCDHDGRLINDPVVLRVDEDTVWFSIADSDVLLWIRAISGERGDDVEVSEPDVSPLAVQGPSATDTVADVFGEWVRELKFFHFRRIHHEGIRLVVSRSGWSKQGGFELYLEDSSKGNQLWDLIWDAGQAYDIRVGAPNYAERIENFLLSWGSDTDAESDPFEAAIGSYVDLGVNHDFVGKSALVAKRAQGPTRELKGLLIDGEPLDANPEPVGLRTPNGAYAGQTRVVAYSPRYERNLGLAIVEVPLNLPGTKLRVQTPTGWRAAIVADLPFDL
jgi:glycine cleavage system aminomethyltransferase T